MKKTEPVPEGDTFFFQVVRSVPVNKSSAVAIYIGSKAGVIIGFGKRIYSYTRWHDN